MAAYSNSPYASAAAVSADQQQQALQMQMQQQMMQHQLQQQQYGQQPQQQQMFPYMDSQSNSLGRKCKEMNKCVLAWLIAITILLVCFLIWCSVNSAGIMKMKEGMEKMGEGKENHTG